MRNKVYSVRKESDAQYADLMLNYIVDKCKKNFNVVETYFPEEGFNTSMLINTLVVQDVETGMLVNVYALLGEPYDFYDNYATSLASFMLKDRIDTSEIDAFATAKLYVYLKEEDINNLDISDANISKTTLVINVTAEPSEAVFESLYEVYNELCAIESNFTRMLVGFTEEAEVFQKYTNNFDFYGDRSWENYDGQVYAKMKITDKGLSYEEFVEQCESCKG